MIKTISLLIFTIIVSSAVAQNVQVINSNILNNSFFYNNFTDDGKGTYYAVSHGYGIFKFDLDGNVERLNTNCFGNPCLDVEVDIDGKLYFASNSGLSTIDENGEMVLLHEDYLLEIELGENGDIYFIAESIADNIYGVYNDGDITGYHEQNSIIKDRYLYSLEADKLGNVWIGAQDGLYKVNDDNIELINEDPVYDLHIDVDNRVHVAQANSTLALLDPINNYEYEKLNYQTVTGRFFVGQPSIMKLAIDNFDDFLYKRSSKWKQVDLSDQGISKDIPRALYMDESGNALYSKDNDNNIYVIRAGEEEYEVEEEEPNFENQTTIKRIKEPWDFVLANSNGYEIFAISIWTDGYADLLIWSQPEASFGSLNLSGLPPGKYKLGIDTYLSWIGKEDHISKDLIIE